ncbi:MAG: hypothetical protein II147_00900 [Lachnospiraceae bacterium]|nr:hypothetical protein [Lachnospiraceae bacterium]
MKATRHNGRLGIHGTYNPKHNDREFNLKNSEHISEENARKNVYWDLNNVNSKNTDRKEVPASLFPGNPRREPKGMEVYLGIESTR